MQPKTRNIKHDSRNKAMWRKIAFPMCNLVSQNVIDDKYYLSRVMKNNQWEIR